ncbi:MAG: FG-GAP-like repeat-containing protein [bacterium]
MRHARFPLLLILVFQIGPASAQQWLWVQDARVLNRSGVQSRGVGRLDFGDIDGDGYVDLLMLDKEGLQAYQNLTAENFVQFQRRPDWETGIALDSVEYSTVPTLTDLDGDGRSEMIVPNSSIKVWKNRAKTGEVRWQQADSLLAGVHGRRYLAVADLDGDGDVDIVTRNPNKLWVYWNVGTPTQPAWQADSSAIDMAEILRETGRSSFNNIRFADLDNDGDADFLATFVVPIAFGELVILENVSQRDSLHFRRFDPPKGFFGGCPLIVAVGDVNNDDTVDLALADHEPFVSFRRNAGTPEQMNFESPVLWGRPQGFLETDVAVGDLDADSDPDLVLGTAQPPTDIAPAVSQIQIYPNEGNATFFNWQHHRTVLDIGYQNLKATVSFNDFDSDGDLDLAVGAVLVEGDILHYKEIGSEIGYYKNLTGGLFAAWELDSTVFAQFAVDSIYYDPVLFDFNGDAALDLLVQMQGSYRFFENTGSVDQSQWEMRSDWSVGLEEEAHYRAAVADLTRDGLPDLVFGELDGKLSFYENVGTSSKPMWQLLPATFEAIAVDSAAAPAFGDLDGDRDLDLLIGDSQGRVFYFRNESTVAVAAQPKATPTDFRLFQNYPNPFNPATTIEYQIARPGRVQLVVYNLRGQRVQVLVDKKQPAGTYRVSWDGRRSGGSAQVASGVYVYELRVGEAVVQRKKMVLLQ